MRHILAALAATAALTSCQAVDGNPAPPPDIKQGNDWQNNGTGHQCLKAPCP